MPLNLVFWVESFLFLLLCSATPILEQRQSPSNDPLVSKLPIIAPQSNSCVGTPYPLECRTASQAVSPILSSFDTYQIVSGPEMAALISLITFETADFKYQNNYFPGNPGQGSRLIVPLSLYQTGTKDTPARNMQSASFNILYARSIPTLASLVAAITEGSTVGALSATQLNQVRALLTENDDYDFGSAAWFLTTQCSTVVRAELQTGTLAGWQAYITDCIGTTATSDRQSIWETAMQQIG